MAIIPSYNSLAICMKFPFETKVQISRLTQQKFSSMLYYNFKVDLAASHQSFFA